MDFSLIQTALELGLICSLTVLALFLSYSMLNVCDLSTDGCFTLGAAVGAVVAISGHPYLALPAAMALRLCHRTAANSNGREQPVSWYYCKHRALLHQHLGDERKIPAELK